MKLEPKLSQYGTTIYTIPKTNIHSRLLLHEFELDLLEQAVKYTYLRAVELVDYFVVIRENNGFTTDDEVRARKNVAKRLIRFKEAGVQANDVNTKGSFFCINASSTRLQNIHLKFYMY